MSNPAEGVDLYSSGQGSRLLVTGTVRPPALTGHLTLREVVFTEGHHASDWPGAWWWWRREVWVRAGRAVGTHWPARRCCCCCHNHGGRPGTT